MATSKNHRLARFFADVEAHLKRRQIVRGPIRSSDSSAFQRSCAGIIYPESPHETAKIVIAANRLGIALNPVSSGLNVGYGDFFPAGRDHVVLHLGRLNRILELNKEEGWVRIEPGVTQAQLTEHLAAHAPEFQFDNTFWLQESSVLGNALERGRTLLSERERDLLGAKLLLSSGKEIETGFNPREHSPLVRGLNLHPLIFQSNLGILLQGIVRIQRPKQALRYWLAAFGSFREFLRANEALSVALPDARILRWYCAESFRQAPLSSGTRQRLVPSAGGVLALETADSITPRKLRSIFPGEFCAVSRAELMTPPSLAAVPSEPVCFHSFATCRSRNSFMRAQKMVNAIRREWPGRIFQTISYLENGCVFLLRCHADTPHRHQARRGFRKVGESIRRHGYISFRDHSALTKNALPDSDLKKMIKSCFDPNGIISPGRYGL